MGTRRMAGIPGFGIDRVATIVGEDPAVLRLENLDTDLRPAQAVLRATQTAVGDDEANSWLPFTGKLDLKRGGRPAGGAIRDSLRPRDPNRHYPR